MKEKDDSAAPRAPRAKATRGDNAAPAAPISKDQLFRIFRDNPGKVFSYRQLSRRLGVTTKEQRDDIFNHLKALRKTGLLTLLQNDDYRLTDASVLQQATEPASGRNTRSSFSRMARI